MAYDFDWKITVVLDKKPFGQSKELMAASPNASFIWPAEPLSYADHTKATRFSGEVLNLAKVVNFTQSLEIAMQSNQGKRPACLH